MADKQQGRDVCHIPALLFMFKPVSVVIKLECRLYKKAESTRYDPACFLPYIS